MQTLIRMQTTDFDLQEEYRGLLARSDNTGAVAVFVGLVRDRDTDVPLSSLFLEYYLEVTENKIAGIVRTTSQCWLFETRTVVHRVGELGPDKQIMLVLAAVAHRKAAFAVVEFIMDYLKAEVPFWKKETFSDGLERWVEAKQSDKEAVEKWSGTQ